MTEFRERAELRNEQMKKLVLELEKKRDALLDQVAEYKGQASAVEEIIKRSYEMILDVNKEEQNKELEVLAKQKEEEKAKKAAEEFAAATKGIKTPKYNRKG